MKIAICDDEYITAEYYYEQIERIFKEYSTECEIELLRTAENSSLLYMKENAGISVFLISICR